MDQSEAKYLETPAELDDTSKLLLKAADRIETHGWCQGNYWVGEKSCLVGAITKAWGSDYKNDGSSQRALAYERVARSLGLPMPADIIAWNDAKERTEDEVVAKLRAVAFMR